MVVQALGHFSGDHTRPWTDACQSGLSVSRQLPVRSHGCWGTRGGIRCAWVLFKATASVSYQSGTPGVPGWLHSSCTRQSVWCGVLASTPWQSAISCCKARIVHVGLLVGGDERARAHQRAEHFAVGLYWAQIAAGAQMDNKLPSHFDLSLYAQPQSRPQTQRPCIARAGWVDDGSGLDHVQGLQVRWAASRQCAVTRALVQLPDGWCTPKCVAARRQL
jgi:hypothetical protein